MIAVYKNTFIYHKRKYRFCVYYSKFQLITLKEIYKLTLYNHKSEASFCFLWCLFPYYFIKKKYRF